MARKHRAKKKLKMKKTVDMAMSMARKQCRNIAWRVGDGVIHHSQPDSVLRIIEIDNSTNEIKVKIEKSTNNEKDGQIFSVPKIELFTLISFREQLEYLLLGSSIEDLQFDLASTPKGM